MASLPSEVLEFVNKLTETVKQISEVITQQCEIAKHSQALKRNFIILKNAWPEFCHPKITDEMTLEELQQQYISHVKYLSKILSEEESGTTEVTSDCFESSLENLARFLAAHSRN